MRGPKRGNRAIPAGAGGEEAEGDGSCGAPEGPPGPVRPIRESAWRQVAGMPAAPPASVFAEDFSLLIRLPRRFRKPSDGRPLRVLDS